MRSRALAALAVLFSVAAAAACADGSCPSGNLAAGASVQAREVQGEPRTLTDGMLAREGWSAEAPQAARFVGPSAEIVADLGAPRSIRALLLQADGDDSYEVQGSSDGWSWRTLWKVPVAQARGLRARATEQAVPETVRHLRVVGLSGEGRLAVSELRAYCRVPASFATAPPPFHAPAAPSWLSRDNLARMRLAVAAAGFLVLLWGAVSRRAGRPELDLNLRDGLLAALGVVAALCWWNLGKFHFDDYVHLWDQLHYYVGSKYAPELGHDGLYECLAVADLEQGLGTRVLERKIRNLSTNRVEQTASIVGDPARCTRRFSAERWAAFKTDVAWFRTQMSPELWDKLALDHGYNPSPLWEAVGGRLSNRTRAGSGTLLGLALIDPVLLAMMWAAVIWAFGWRATAVGLLWWGTNAVADFAWTGGGFLRMDWLALTVVGICFVRRGFPFLGAAALTWATLLRIFPGFVVLGLLLKTAVTMLRERRFAITPAQRRFALGGFVTLAVLVPVSFSARGPAAWAAFARNSAKHLADPQTNSIGLDVVTSWESSTRMELMRNPMLEDSDAEWKEARLGARERRSWIRWTLLAAYLALLGAAVSRQEDWAALVLAVGLIPFATAQSCYYFGVLLIFGTLGSTRWERIGAALCALSIWTHAVRALWPERVQYDQRFVSISVAVLLFVTGLAIAAWREQAGEGSTVAERVNS